MARHRQIQDSRHINQKNNWTSHIPFASHSSITEVFVTTIQFTKSRSFNGFANRILKSKTLKLNWAIRVSTLRVQSFYLLLYRLSYPSSLQVQSFYLLLCRWNYGTFPMAVSLCTSPTGWWSCTGTSAALPTSSGILPLRTYCSAPDSITWWVWNRQLNILDFSQVSMHCGIFLIIYLKSQKAQCIVEQTGTF